MSKTSKMSVRDKDVSPRVGDAAAPAQVSNGQKEAPWWAKLKQGLQVASQLVMATPLGLPTKVVQVARYLHLALGIIEGLERSSKADASEGDGHAP